MVTAVTITSVLMEYDSATTECYVSVGARCWWRSWLRHCATSRKVAVSIPDGVIGFFIAIILPAALWHWGRLNL